MYIKQLLEKLVLPTYERTFRANEYLSASLPTMRITDNRAAAVSWSTLEGLTKTIDDIVRSTMTASCTTIIFFHAHAFPLNVKIPFIVWLIPIPASPTPRGRLNCLFCSCGCSCCTRPDSPQRVYVYREIA